MQSAKNKPVQGTFLRICWMGILELSSANRPEFLPEETLLFVQDEVGLYEGRNKLPDHQSGHVYLTSHRICYVDNAEPRKKSTCVPLKSVERAEYSTGFFKSSPKISLFPKIPKQAAVQALASRTTELSLGGSPPKSPGSPFPRNGSPFGTQSLATNTLKPQSVTWVCPICSFSNTLPPGFDATVANEQTTLPKCQTCGIKPPLAHLLKAAISSATVGGAMSRDSSYAPTAALSSSPSGKIPIPKPANSLLAGSRPSHVCPRCTFENHPSLQACEMCGASLATMQGPEFGSAGSQSRTDSPGPMGDERADCIKLSFRAGGDKIFHERLKGALLQRKWLSDHAPPVPQPQLLTGDSRSAPGSGTQTPEPKGVGIAGLERRGLERRRNNEAVISTAFEDLEALIASAQDIINLAESFANKSSDASASDIISDAAGSLSTTKDMLDSGGGGSDSLYLSQLSRELAEYLTNDRVGALRRVGGIMSLVDLWAEFNGLRNGVELISPSDFEKAARLWEKLALPVRLREFRNGLLVVQRYDRTDDKTIAEILAWLQELHMIQPSASTGPVPAWDFEVFGYGVTAREAARRFGWSVGVATEELEMAEENGMLCREESIEGLKYWENWIVQG